MSNRVEGVFCYRCGKKMGNPKRHRSLEIAAYLMGVLAVGLNLVLLAMVV